MLARFCFREAAKATLEMTNRPMFSVIVPTCNRTAGLRACLLCLEEAREATSPGQCEIIVTDDGFSDEAREMVAFEFPSVRWTAGPRRGPASNRNHGARQATGEWLVFIDDDCLPDGQLLRGYSEAVAANPERVVLEGRISPDRKKSHPLEECPINEKGGNLWSCNFAIKVEVFFGVGAFDEGFPHAAGEDWELAYRLRKEQISTYFTPGAMVVHPWRKRSLLGHLAQQSRILHSNRVAIRKHAELQRLFTPWNVVKDVARYYARTFREELKTCGFGVLAYQPVFMVVQAARLIVYFQEQHRHPGKLMPQAHRTSSHLLR